MELHDKTLDYFIYLDDLKDTITRDNEDSKLKEAYNYVSDVAYLYYKNKKMDNLYNYLHDAVIECEKLVNSYITDVKTTKKNTSVISDIADLGRRYLQVINSFNRANIKDYDSIDVSGDCKKSAENIQEICNKMGLKCHTINIDPGYNKDLALYYGDGYHYFNIVELENNYFLIDLTYKQFFLKRQNILERLNVVLFSGCLPGVFMEMDERRKKTADELLKYGYIKLDEDKFKDYLDGFTMSYRNGLYYRDHDFNGYSIDKYIEFLTTDANMGDYEDKKYLGYLKRPLKKGK